MQKFFAAIRNASDIPELWDAFTGYFEQHHIDHLCLIHIPPPGAHDFGKVIIATIGYPDAFRRRYIEDKLYLDDPIPDHARHHPMPFRWSEIGEMRKLTSPQISFLKEVEQLGIGDGLAIPVFGPHGRNGYVGLALGPHNEDTSDELLHEFQAIAQMAHQRYCELLSTEETETITLSPREKEVLVWVARGKSNNAISSILGISANTVDTHLRRIYDKLGVSDRTTAAIRGIGCGLIAP
ncbi:LuxR family transcriptional regulator [Parasphingopyxis lamellibrachiae]|uniref:LuxR family transcriptional regulator/LuxR family quorum-sensing system transcriptional regulator CciR n=1 Tax=Parasphingopyxis lamellibrachiae TaxID=680125 RepID=A0A3D9FI80_9SPHN|nr:LuxR family transcriptional regulator [Parasphingopyxis lamellibrachiae]RED17504.1 LuxR family transcriptional regulator/LuxR family quorum-sensing system transcriptional regulator CciR [Parasphingopyxis lamellibrachiae]